MLRKAASKVHALAPTSCMPRCIVQGPAGGVGVKRWAGFVRGMIARQTNGHPPARLFHSYGWLGSQLRQHHTGPALMPRNASAFLESPCLAETWARPGAPKGRFRRLLRKSLFLGCGFEKLCYHHAMLHIPLQILTGLTGESNCATVAMGLVFYLF